jgi:hypothetical protein
MKCKCVLYVIHEQFEVGLYGHSGYLFKDLTLFLGLVQNNEPGGLSN